MHRLLLGAPLRCRFNESRHRRGVLVLGSRTACEQLLDRASNTGFDLHVSARFPETAALHYYQCLILIRPAQVGLAHDKTWLHSRFGCRISSTGSRNLPPLVESPCNERESDPTIIRQEANTRDKSACFKGHCDCGRSTHGIYDNRMIQDRDYNQHLPG